MYFKIHNVNIISCTVENVNVQSFCSIKEVQLGETDDGDAFL